MLSLYQTFPENVPIIPFKEISCEFNKKNKYRPFDEFEIKVLIETEKIEVNLNSCIEKKS